jgi:arginyl-tRNA synthetase
VPIAEICNKYSIRQSTFAYWLKVIAELSIDLKKTEIELAELEGFTVKATGPYLNFTVSSKDFVEGVLKDYLQKESLIKKLSEGKTILVESPSPNTNKPLHLGHLRNILLGQSITKLLKAIGHDAKIVNVVNDRGIHICKSMLAYKKWGEGSTPESSGRKPDHFVGDWYVRFSKEASKSPEDKEKLEKEAQEMLIAWENKDPEVMALWEKGTLTRP